MIGRTDKLRDEERAFMTEERAAMIKERKDRELSEAGLLEQDKRLVGDLRKDMIGRTDKLRDEERAFMTEERAAMIKERKARELGEARLLDEDKRLVGDLRKDMIGR